jgi:hypothetical protein
MAGHGDAVRADHGSAAITGGSMVLAERSATNRTGHCAIVAHGLAANWTSGVDVFNANGSGKRCSRAHAPHRATSRRLDRASHESRIGSRHKPRILLSICSRRIGGPRSSCASDSGSACPRGSSPSMRAPLSCTSCLRRPALWTIWER